MIEILSGMASAVAEFKKGQFGTPDLMDTRYHDIREKLTLHYNQEKDLKTRITLQNLLIQLDDAYFDFAKRQMSKQLAHYFL